MRGRRAENRWRARRGGQLRRWATDLRAIRLRYLRTWFLIDVIPYVTLFLPFFWLPIAGTGVKIVREAAAARANARLREAYGSASEAYGSVPEGHRVRDGDPPAPGATELAAPSAPLVCEEGVVVEGTIIEGTAVGTVAP